MVFCLHPPAAPLLQTLVMLPGLLLWLTVLFMTLGSTADDFFTRALLVLSEKLRSSPPDRPRSVARSDGFVYINH